MRFKTIMTRLAVLSILFGSFAWTALAGRDGDPQKTLREARRLVARGDLEAARKTLTGLLRETPKGEAANEARVLMARVLLRGRTPQEAFDYLSRTISSIAEDSSWRGKARFLLAKAAEEVGKGGIAARIYGEEAVSRNSESARLVWAKILVDRAEALLHPQPTSTDPTAEAPSPDFSKVILLFHEASHLLPEGVNRSRYVLREVDAHLEVNDYGQATHALAEVLSRHAPDGPQPDPDLFAEALYRRARVELGGGHRGKARETLDALSRHPAASRFRDLEILLGRTYGLPKPTTRELLSAGVAHWMRFLERYPQDERGESLRRELVSAYLAVGENEDAEREARRYLALHPGSEHAPAMLLAAAESRVRRGDLAGARGVFSEFLSSYPDDPQAPRVQQRLPELLFQQIEVASSEERWDDALVASRAFLGRYAEHGKAPEVAVKQGRLLQQSKRFDEAASAWRSAFQRYREAAPAAAAQAGLLRGILLEEKNKELADAVKQYREVIKACPSAPATAECRRRIGMMEAVEVAIAVPSVFRTDQTPRIRVSLRNRREATLRIYPVRMETWFRVKHNHWGFEKLDLTLVQAARKLKVKPLEFRPYRLEEIDVPLSLGEEKGLPPGAYALTLEDGEREARAVVLVSDLSAIVKEGPRQMLVFVQNLRTDQVVPGARVLVIDQTGKLVEGETDEHGVWLHDFKSESSTRQVLVLHEGQVAPGCAPRPEKGHAPDFTPKGWMVSDRTIYRPGEEVQVFGIVRRGGRTGWTMPAPGTPIQLEIFDVRGRRVAMRTAKMNPVGMFSVKWRIPPEMPLGKCRLVARDRDFGFDFTFEVAEFRAARMAVTVKPEKPSPFAKRPGERVPFVVEAKDLFGRPVKNRRVVWRVYRSFFQFDPSPLRDHAWFFQRARNKGSHQAILVEQGQGQTDESGHLVFPVKAGPEGLHARFHVQATVIGEDGVAVTGYGEMFMEARSFHLHVVTQNKAFRSGDRIKAEVFAVGPAMEPVPVSCVVALMAKPRGAQEPREIRRVTVQTGLDGRGMVEIPVEGQGDLFLRVEAPDPAGGTITAMHSLRADSSDFEEAHDIRLAAVKSVWREGESLAAYLDVPTVGRPMLLTLEADGVLDYQIVVPKKRRVTVRWPLTVRHAPNVFLAAALLHDGAVRTAVDEVTVLRWLDVEVKPRRNDYRPGDEVELEITTRDQSGNPTSASVGLAVVDRAVLALASDTRGDVRGHFYRGRRKHRVRTSSTAAFKQVAAARVLDPDLRASLEADRRMREWKKVRDELERATADSPSLEKGKSLYVEEPKGAQVGEDPADGRRKEARYNEAVGLGGGAGGKFGGLRMGRRSIKKPGSRIRDVHLITPSLATAYELEIERNKLQFGAVEDSLRKAIEQVTGHEGPQAPETPRRRILPVAFFKAGVMTDEKGRAVLRFRLPGNITTWAVRAVGASPDTHVGEGSAHFRVVKPIAVSLGGPRHLSEKDRTTIHVDVTNHTSSSMSIATSMKVSGALKMDGETSSSAVVEPGDDARLSIPVHASGFGKATLKGLAESSSGVRDSLEESLTIEPFGLPGAAGASALIEGRGRLEVDLPASTLLPTVQGQIVLSASVGHDVLALAGRLMTRGGGGVAGTAARALALFDIMDLVSAGRMRLPFDAILLEQVLREDLERLTAAQNSHGSFPWWHGQKGDPYVTAMALEAFRRAETFGFDEISQALGAADAAAMRMLAGPVRPWHPALLDALSRGSSDIGEAFRKTLRASSRLSPAGLAHLTLAALRRRQAGQARDLVTVLEGRLVRDGGFVRARGDARGCWEVSPVLSSGVVLRALLEAERKGPLVDGLAAYLRSTVHRYRGISPSVVSEAVRALGVYSAHAALADWEGVVEVSVNGRSVGRLQRDPEGGPPHRALALDGSILRAGKNVLDVRTHGAGPVWIHWEVEWVEPAEKIPASQGPIRMSRRIVEWTPPEQRDATVEPGYEIVRPESRPKRKDAPSLPDLVEGRIYEVILDVTVPRTLEYLTIEAPLQAGCVVLEDEIEAGGNPWERTATSLVIHVRRLSKGKHRFRYAVVAAWPGSYRVLPATVQVADDPSRRAHASDLDVRVLPVSAASARKLPRTLTPDESLAQGKLALGHHMYDEALKHFRGLLDLDLEEEVRSEVERSILRCHLELSHWKDAVAVDEGALFPISGLTAGERLLLGRAYEEMGDFMTAVRRYATVIAERLDATWGAAKCLESTADVERAQSIALALVRGAPDTARVAKRWVDTAERFFSIPSPELKDNTSLPAMMRMQWSRGLREYEIVLAHEATMPDADQTAWTYLNHLARLGMAEHAARSAREFLSLYPESPFADNAQMLVLKSAFSERDWIGAKAAAQALTKPRWVRIDRGRRVKGGSVFSDEAIYHLGRIAHVEGRIGEAVKYYGQIKEKFEDARESWMFFTEKVFEVPDLVRMTPGKRISLATRVKNIDGLTWSLFKVDLPLVFTVRKSLSALNRVDLTGIKPDAQGKKSKLGSRFTAREVAIDLGELKPGAYLLVLEGMGRLTTSVVMVTDLRILLQRTDGNLRVWVTRGPNDVPVADAQVKVGNGRRIVATGKTDERGIYLLKGAARGVTVLAADGVMSVIASER